MVCGLVHRFGSLNVISDNAGCFGGRPLPRNGCLVEFGGLTVYVTTEVVCRYPERYKLLRILLLSTQLAAGISLAPLAAWR